MLLMYGAHLLNANARPAHELSCKELNWKHRSPSIKIQIYHMLGAGYCTARYPISSTIYTTQSRSSSKRVTNKILMPTNIRSIIKKTSIRQALITALTRYSEVRTLCTDLPLLNHSTGKKLLFIEIQGAIPQSVLLCRKQGPSSAFKRSFTTVLSFNSSTESKPLKHPRVEV